MRHFPLSSWGTWPSVLLPVCLPVCLAPCVQLPEEYCCLEQMEVEWKELVSISGSCFSLTQWLKAAEAFCPPCLVTTYNCNPPLCPARYISRMVTSAENTGFAISKWKAFLRLLLALHVYWCCLRKRLESWGEKKATKEWNSTAADSPWKFVWVMLRICICLYLHKNKFITTGQLSTQCFGSIWAMGKPCRAIRQSKVWFSIYSTIF